MLIPHHILYRSQHSVKDQPWTLWTHHCLMCSMHLFHIFINGCNVFQMRSLVRCWVSWRPSQFHTQPFTQLCNPQGSVCSMWVLLLLCPFIFHWASPNRKRRLSLWSQAWAEAALSCRPEVVTGTSSVGSRSGLVSMPPWSSRWILMTLSPTFTVLYLKEHRRRINSSRVYESLVVCIMFFLLHRREETPASCCGPKHCPWASYGAVTGMTTTSPGSPLGRRSAPNSTAQAATRPKQSKIMTVTVKNEY